MTAFFSDQPAYHNNAVFYLNALKKNTIFDVYIKRTGIFLRRILLHGFPAYY